MPGTDVFGVLFCIREPFVHGFRTQVAIGDEEHVVEEKFLQLLPVIVDELGYLPFSKEGAELLFQVLAERHERGSVIITTNLGFGDWTQVFGDPNMTAGLLDRLTHRAHILDCSWDSYRLKQTVKTKGSSKRTEP